MDIWFVFAFSLFCLMCAWSFRFTQVVTSAYLPGSYDESVFQSGSFKFCSSTNSAWGFQFLHFLAKTCDWIQVPLLVIWFSNIFFWSMHVFSIFLMVSFEMPNLFYLNEAQLIFFFFSFYQCTFGIMSKKSLPNWMSVSSWCWPKILLAWFRRNWPATPCIQCLV